MIVAEAVIVNIVVGTTKEMNELVSPDQFLPPICLSLSSHHYRQHHGVSVALQKKQSSASCYVGSSEHSPHSL
jgi:hypothetical protein